MSSKNSQSMSDSIVTGFEAATPSLNKQIFCKHSVPLFGKERLGEILLNKSPSIPLFQRGELNVYNFLGLSW
jgi:hypothetical protein